MCEYIYMCVCVCVCVCVCMLLCLVTQLCPTLANPMNCSPPGSSVHGCSPGKNIDQTQVSYIAGRFFTIWAAREAHIYIGAQRVKDLPANAGQSEDVGLIPGSGRSPGEGKGSPLQYFYLENPVDREACGGYSPQDARVGHDWSD